MWKSASVVSGVKRWEVFGWLVDLFVCGGFLSLKAGNIFFPPWKNILCLSQSFSEGHWLSYSFLLCKCSNLYSPPNGYVHNVSWSFRFCWIHFSFICRFNLRNEIWKKIIFLVEQVMLLCNVEKNWKAAFTSDMMSKVLLDTFSILFLLESKWYKIVRISLI